MKEYKTYEDAAQRLEEIVLQLESGELPLEESLGLFEEGSKLAAFCYDTLKHAEQKIKLLTLPEENTDEQ